MTRAESLRPQLEGFVARVQRETRVPGIGVAVSIAGERLETHAGTRVAGLALPLGSDARYHLGCTTKLLLAMLALELAQHGVLDVDAAVGDYVAELRCVQHGRQVRVAHLLSHTSGYRGTHILDEATRVDRWDDFVAYLKDAPALFLPGTVFSYEHTESVLLAEVVRRVTGRASLELIVERLLAPLGIEPGTVGPAVDGRDAGRHRFDVASASFVPLAAVPAVAPFWLPAFSAYTVTLGELLGIAETAIGARPTQLLASATRTALATTVVRLPPAAGGPLSELLPVGFGLGTGELRDGCRGNTGISAGQCLGLRFDTQARVAIAVALNATAPHVRDFILATVAGELVRRPAPREAAPFGFDFAALTGTYLGPGGGVVRAHCDHDRLVCEIGREHRRDTLRVELSLDAGGRLVLRSPVPQLSIGFVAEPQGGALGLMLGLSAYRRVALDAP
jgi:CubicO group peptidase (beta-lactamase class C family)